jgi:hypothetical protein
MTLHTRRSSAARITTAGRAWHDPVGGQTPWQREQIYGRAAPMDGSERIGSLWPVMLAVLTTVLCFYAIAKGWHL